MLRLLSQARGEVHKKLYLDVPSFLRKCRQKHPLIKVSAGAFKRRMNKSLQDCDDTSLGLHNIFSRMGDVLKSCNVEISAQDQLWDFIVPVSLFIQISSKTLSLCVHVQSTLDNFEEHYSGFSCLLSCWVLDSLELSFFFSGSPLRAESPTVPKRVDPSQ